MPRLRNTSTGTVVNVDDATAALLRGYEPIKAEQSVPEPEPEQKQKPVRRSPRAKK